MKQEENISLSRWLQGQLSAAEEQELAKTHDLEQLRATLRAQESLELETVDSADLWQQMSSQFDQPKPETKATWVRVLWFIIGMIVGFSTLYLLFGDSSDKIKTEQAQTIEHSFADNSKVILAPDSRLSFDDKNWSTNRHVKLSGQAYFEVNKGTEFSVETKAGTVTVLGTKFEVWQRAHQMRVTCTEGKVKVSNKQQSASETITIGQEILLNNGDLSNVAKSEAETAQFLSGRQEYDQITVEELLAELGRFYDLDILPKGINLQEAYSGILILDDLDRCLKLLSTSMSWDYDLEQQKLQITTQ